MKRKLIYIILAIIVSLPAVYIWIQSALVDTGENNTTKNGFKDVISNIMPTKLQNHGVSSSNELAVDIGLSILEEGGNAVDAAIAVSYALGVAEPHASGIGGGGGMLILPPEESQEPVFYDYREVAPLTGEKSEQGVGVPGFVRGMEVVNKDYGTMTMSDLIEPSIKLAENGVPLKSPLGGLLKQDDLYGLSKEGLPEFYPNGVPLENGDILRQKDLANTLRNIQHDGASAFYGETNVNAITQRISGLNYNDFSQYEVVKREPVVGKFMGYNVLTAPPPFSGVSVIQALQMAEKMEIERYKDDTVSYVHLTSEIFQRVYNNRMNYIGDPKYSKIPVEELTSVSYAENLSADISIDQSSDQYDLDEEDLNEESVSTTHFVVVDKDGMVVSVTNTLGHFFGSGVYVNGYFLNESLNIFSSNPSSPNRIEPGKRSRTFTSPTILQNDEEVIGIGSPGGSRIPMMITESLVQHISFEESLEQAVEKPRFYSENRQIFTEIQYPIEIRRRLQSLGYSVQYNDASLFFGGIQVLKYDRIEEELSGVSDSRRNGKVEIK